MTKRVHIEIRGAVQGVGFRPFVYRLATELGLSGWVMNAAAGVVVNAEGDEGRVGDFVVRIEREKPPRAFIQSFEFSYLDPIGFTSFLIRESDGQGELSVFVLPDIATCPDCLAEILDPTNRRFEYPFTNCTNCGPRYTIVEALPYDRPNTSMKSFVMCEECRGEYDDPVNRRFHAQPNACATCGPHLELWDAAGNVIASRANALQVTAGALLAGSIVAVKGLGGFHLIVDATNEASVSTLRFRKRREEKPLALMVRDLDAVTAICEVSPMEERLLRSAETPIVLLRKRHGDLGDGKIVGGIAPGNPTLGVMLPYTPLHHLLLKKVNRPLVATSGNLTDEPICTDGREALERLAGIADLFLVHNRPIVRYVDDSIVRVLLDRELVLRRSRGYAPLPVSVPHLLPDALSMGAHLKSTVAMARGNSIFISQHLGDLASAQSLLSFRSTIKDFVRLYQLKPTTVVADMHPDYISTAEAKGMELPLHQIQHHYAHVASCMAEHALTGDVLGVSWDGTGWGEDGTIWGGEFLVIGNRGFKRVASFLQFALPGGEAAIKEPRRSAFGMVHEFPPQEIDTLMSLPCFEGFGKREIRVMRRAMERHINAPRTSSVGRLFDGVASILGIRHCATFEGQAAMELEWLATSVGGGASFEIPLRESLGTGDTIPIPYLLDWIPCIRHMVLAIQGGTSPALLAYRFHVSMAEVIVAVARRVGQHRVVLSGGCFQNALLTALTVQKLQEAGFTPHWHQRIPPNDGGISLGQLYAALVLEK